MKIFLVEVNYTDIRIFPSLHISEHSLSFSPYFIKGNDSTKNKNTTCKKFPLNFNMLGKVSL